MGRAIVAGGARASEPVTGTPLSDLAVGSIIKLNENGSPVDYIVVNQGIPSNSSLYDSSCDGVWLLRKNVYGDQQWASSDLNDYKNSTIHSYLNSTFLGLFDTAIQSIIKSVKIPYRNGSGKSATVTSGSNGMSTQIFLLSGTEVGFTHTHMPADEGAKLSYFNWGTSADSKRIAYLDTGSAYGWWLRTPELSGTSYVWSVASDGAYNRNYGCEYYNGVRPAFILPSDALLQDDGTIKV